MRGEFAVAKVIVATLAAIVVLAAGGVLYLGVSAHTPPPTDAEGREIPGGIATLEKLELGEFDQWILVRGVDPSNPVLLWLHGGPGGAQMPFAHHLDGELERRFVVVHWDQPGAGKSNHRGFDEKTMRLERYLRDARRLIDYLRVRLGQDKIVLLGHSWGTRLGMELIQAHPEYFHAYIGVGQVVNHDRATELARDRLLETIDPDQSPDDRRRLGEIEIPARRHGEYRKLNQLVDAYGGGLDLSIWSLARIAVRAPEYTALDYWRLLRGMNRGGGPMHKDGIIAAYNLIEAIPAVDVPVYFFSGANDYNTPLVLVREYFEILDAPHKEFVVFENSAHLPFFAETARFTEQVIRVAEREGLGGRVPTR